MIELKVGKINEMKELLIILRDNLETYMKANPVAGGMCDIILSLSGDGIITKPEAISLMKYIDEHEPLIARIRYKLIPAWDRNGDGFLVHLFWFRPRAIHPRLRWLNRQIRKQ